MEALRVFMLGKKVECRPVWKPMHKQPVYKNAPAYLNGVSESIFKNVFCLPADPYVTDDEVTVAKNPSQVPISNISGNLE